MDGSSDNFFMNEEDGTNDGLEGDTWPVLVFDGMLVGVVIGCGDKTLIGFNVGSLIDSSVGSFVGCIVMNGS